MASKYAFITAGSTNYLPGLKAFFNSLRVTKHLEDVILLSHKLPQEFLDWLKTMPYQVIVVEDQGNDQVQGTAIERFKVAAEYGKNYDAICLCEADLFLTNNVGTFFDVAAAGFVVTGSNGMVVDFARDYQKQYGIDLGKDHYIYPKVHTTVPIFLGKRDLDWFSDFYAMRGSARSFDDVFGLNVLGIKKGIDKRMICLAPYVFTGIHHFGVKPETGWIEKDGIILSGTEEYVYMIHGKWWDEGWVSDLPITMGRYFKDQDMGSACKRRMDSSIQLGLTTFYKLLDMR